MASPLETDASAVFSAGITIEDIEVSCQFKVLNNVKESLYCFVLTMIYF